MASEFTHLFTPIRIGPVQVKNRIYMTPHSLGYAEPLPEDPCLLVPGERHVHYDAEIGDCVSPRRLGEAVYEGHKVGRTI